MSPRFYVNCPLQPGPLDLCGAEAHHLASVSRLRPGDALCLFNGDGQEYPARVVAVQRRFVSLEVLGVQQASRELPFPLLLAAPVPKGDRAHFLVEKLTELGVTAFVPLRTRRSVVHPGEGKSEKLQRYVIEASKQCGRNTLMTLEPLADWETFCARADLPGLKLLAHPGGGVPEDGLGARLAAAGTGVAVAVGPEGGFTTEEVEHGLRHGWQPVDLGPRLLRIETAAVALAAAAGLAGMLNRPEGGSSPRARGDASVPS